MKVAKIEPPRKSLRIQRKCRFVFSQEEEEMATGKLKEGSDSASEGSGSLFPASGGEETEGSETEKEESGSGMSEEGSTVVMDLQTELAMRLGAKRPALEQSMEVGEEEAWHSGDEEEEVEAREEEGVCVSQQSLYVFVHVRLIS